MVSKKTYGLLIAIFGFIWLVATGAISFIPLSMVKFGPLEVRDISEASAVNLFIRFGLFIFGTYIYLKTKSGDA